MAKDAIKMSGIVIKTYNSNEFDVKLENNIVVKAHISGKIRVHHITILRGDKVDVELSAYDLTKGRIVYRHK